MLRLHKIDHLAQILSIPSDVLEETSRSTKSYVRLLEVLDVGKLESRSSRAVRKVISVFGIYRRIQKRLQSRVFRRKFEPSPCNHGGVRGRSAITNATVHQGERFFLKMDVSNFFPSLDTKRLCSFFSREQECSPKVAALLTRLCTFDFHLAIGLITSPILADQLFLPADRRISDLCECYNLEYSRFVDDLTISGSYDFTTRGVKEKVDEILRSVGLSSNWKKTKFESLSQGPVVTGIQLTRGGIDVPTDYLSVLNARIENHRSLGDGGEFVGPFYSKSQLLGRVYHAGYLNPSRLSGLLRRFRKIDWERVEEVAKGREIISVRTILAPRGESLSQLAELLGKTQDGLCDIKNSDGRLGSVGCHTRIAEQGGRGVT